MEKTYLTRKLFKYVEGLEKAYALIDNDSTFLTGDLNNKLKKVRDELVFIIEDIDEEYRKELFGEGE